MIASPPLDLGTSVRLIETVTANHCCFAEGQRGKVIAVIAEGREYDVAFDAPEHPVGRIGASSLEPLFVIHVRDFNADMLAWLDTFISDYWVRAGSVMAQREITKITFGRGEDIKLFRTDWPGRIVEDVVSAASGEADTSTAPDPDQADARHPHITTAQAAAARARAAALMPQAVAGGLRCSVYLPPALAAWVLERVADGMFADPAEAVFVGMSEYRDLLRQTDLRTELLQRSLQHALSDPAPPVDAADFIAGLRKKLAAPLPDPAIWPRNP